MLVCRADLDIAETSGTEEGSALRRDAVPRPFKQLDTIRINGGPNERDGTVYLHNSILTF